MIESDIGPKRCSCPHWTEVVSDEEMDFMLDLLHEEVEEVSPMSLIDQALNSDDIVEIKRLLQQLKEIS